MNNTNYLCTLKNNKELQMRKYFYLALGVMLLMASSCYNSIDAPLIVTSVKKTALSDSPKRYCVYVNDESVRIYTNILYKVGDTIQ
jgi:hypothetical protein